MKYEEIIKRVNWGEEFCFYYDNEEYWISQDGLKKYLTRVSDSMTQEFQTAEELFEHGKIKGKFLKDIWNDIEKYF